MSFDDFFRKDRPNKMPQITPSRLAAGFTRTSGAPIAHFSVGDGPEAWGPSAATSVLWGLSYVLWCRLQAQAGERLTAR